MRLVSDGDEGEGCLRVEVVKNRIGELTGLVVCLARQRQHEEAGRDAIILDRCLGLFLDL